MVLPNFCWWFLRIYSNEQLENSSLESVEYLDFYAKQKRIVNFFQWLVMLGFLSHKIIVPTPHHWERNHMLNWFVCFSVNFGRSIFHQKELWVVLLGSASCPEGQIIIFSFFQVDVEVEIVTNIRLISIGFVQILAKFCSNNQFC